MVSLRAKSSLLSSYPGDWSAKGVYQMKLLSWPGDAPPTIMNLRAGTWKPRLMFILVINTDFFSFFVTGVGVLWETSVRVLFGRDQGLILSFFGPQSACFKHLLNTYVLHDE